MAIAWIKRCSAVVTPVLVVGLAAGPARAGGQPGPGNPVLRYEYGDGSAADRPPALVNVTTLGLGSQGRIQLAFPDRVDEVTAVGENSRSLSVTSPVAVATDGTNDFVALSGGGVRAYAATSPSSMTWAAGVTASALAVTSADPFWGEEIVWVADPTHNQIDGFDSTGQPVTTLASRTTHISGLTTLPDGTLLVLDGSVGIVQRLTSQGVPIGRFGSNGSGDGQFSGASSIAADGDGAVFVADTGNSRIEMFDGHGNYEGQFGAHVPYTGAYAPGEFTSPRSVAVDCIGRLHVLDVVPGGSALGPQPAGRVAVYTGVAAPTGSCYGPDTDGFAGPKFDVVGVDRAGNYYAATATKITKYAPDGSVITSWLSPASGPGHWAAATAITVAPDGDVYLADGDQKLVLQFHAAGEFVRSVSGGDGFIPISVAVRPTDGHVFVSYLRHSVEEFSATGSDLGALKLAKIDGSDALPWVVGMSGDQLLVTGDQAGPPYETAVERFDPTDSYLDQVRGPGRPAADDILYGVAPYPGGGYAVLGIPSTGDFEQEPATNGLLRLSSDGQLLGRIAEPELPADSAASSGLAVDCAGRIVAANASTGRIFRLATSSAVCKWLPTATTGTLAGRTSTSLTVKAAVNPAAQVTRMRVQYGPTKSYGSATGWVTLPSDNVTIKRTVTIAGLGRGHSYHYRVQATNASGPAFGQDRTATTS